MRKLAAEKGKYKPSLLNVNVRKGKNKGVLFKK